MSKIFVYDESKKNGISILDVPKHWSKGVDRDDREKYVLACLPHLDGNDLSFSVDMLRPANSSGVFFMSNWYRGDSFEISTKAKKWRKINEYLQTSDILTPRWFRIKAFMKDFYYSTHANCHSEPICRSLESLREFRLLNQVIIMSKKEIEDTKKQLSLQIEWLKTFKFDIEYAKAINIIYSFDVDGKVNHLGIESCINEGEIKTFNGKEYSHTDYVTYIEKTFQEVCKSIDSSHDYLTEEIVWKQK